MPFSRKSARRLKKAARPRIHGLPTLNDMSDRFNTALIFSLIVHTAVIFGLTFRATNPELFRSAKPLEVVLVNARSKSKPLKPDVLAQYNLNGGGNVAEERHVKSPLPASRHSQIPSSASLQRQIKAERQKARNLLARIKSNYAVATRRSDKATKPKPSTTPQAPLNLDATSVEMAQLRARIAREIDAYEKRPRRVFIGARAQKYSYARYVEDWRLKVERIGNLNYPEAAKRNHIYGSLKLTVNIRSDGTLDSAQVDRSSGSKILDAAALKIVRMSAPFSPFPPKMRKSVDILSITRIWTFTNTQDLETSGN